jgi:hypothetical protein
MVGALEGGVVHQDVDAAELADGPVDHGAAVGGVGDVARHQHAAAPRRLDVAGGLAGVRVLSLVQVADQEIAPSRAKAIATARPIPLSPPVITAARPASLFRSPGSSLRRGRPCGVISASVPGGWICPGRTGSCRRSSWRAPTSAEIRGSSCTTAVRTNDTGPHCC